MGKFTDAYVRNLKPRDRRYDVFEKDGFGVRVYPSGEKSFQYLYKFEGRQRRMSIGRYPSTSLSQARKVFTQARAERLQHKDPALERQRQRDEAKRRAEIDMLTPTITVLAEEYIERWSKPRKKTWREDQRILNKDVIPLIGNKKAHEVKRNEVVRVLEIVADRAPIQANRTLAVIRRMFNHAVERGILNRSPVEHIKAPAKEISRQRVLTPNEIKLFWDQLDTTPMSEHIRLCLRFLLTTGQRRGEVLLAEWSEFEEPKWWNIPATHTKTNIAHRVPLTGMSQDILNRLRQIGRSDRYIFPSPKCEKPISPTSINHALRRAFDRGCLNGVDAFSPHDLRRSLATSLSELGINRLIQDKVLNHKDNTVGGIYDRNRFDAEKQRALIAWEHRLKEILSGEREGNVVSIGSI